MTLSKAFVKNYPVPNGVIFIYDQSINLIVPEDTSAAPIMVTENCISVWTVGEYEGLVDILLTSDNISPEGEIIFYGKIKTKGKTISINRLDTNIICEIEIDDVYLDICIFAVNFPNTTYITCKVGCSGITATGAITP